MAKKKKPIFEVTISNEDGTTHIVVIYNLKQIWQVLLELFQGAEAKVKKL